MNAMLTFTTSVVAARRRRCPKATSAPGGIAFVLLSAIVPICALAVLVATKLLG